MLFRSAAESDFESILPLLVPDPASTLTASTYRARLESREYLPHRTWIAAAPPNGQPVAVAVWWTAPSEPHPAALDALLVADQPGSIENPVDVAAGLLRAAHAAYADEGLEKPPDFHVFLPGDWSGSAGTIAALNWRQEAARQAGLPASLERLRYEWTPRAGLPAPSRRLAFRAEPDDEVFVDLFRQVLACTLDATSGREAKQIGAEAQARKDVEFYRSQMPGDRAWWRVAETLSGEPVGFGVPSRNTDFPVVGYLGVLPAQRGHGYVGDILNEITRVLVIDADAQIIRADTDLANIPMAAAFDRAGYENFGRRLVFSADSSLWFGHTEPEAP